MRKYMRTLFWFLRLIKEICLNLGTLKVHGYRYCICSGVEFWTHDCGYCDIGEKTWLSENCLLESSWRKISLGYNNFFNSNYRIISLESVIIGDNNLFESNVIIDYNHIYSDLNKLKCQQGFSKRQVKISSDIWIGGNVTQCLGMKIGYHVVVGANSVVSKSIFEPRVFVSSPARKIKD